MSLDCTFLEIQAAISAVHCRAAQYDKTDWQEIVNLYEALRVLAPSGVIDLNHAVAVSRLEGPEVGLQRLEALRENVGVVRRHHLCTPSDSSPSWASNQSVSASAAMSWRSSCTNIHPFI